MFTLFYCWCHHFDNEEKYPNFLKLRKALSPNLLCIQICETFSCVQIYKLRICVLISVWMVHFKNFISQFNRLTILFYLFREQLIMFYKRCMTKFIKNFNWKPYKISADHISFININYKYQFINITFYKIITLA